MDGWYLTDDRKNLKKWKFPQMQLVRGAYLVVFASGKPDEEYIELVNPNLYAVDVSGWRLAGGVEHALLPGTVLVAGGRLYLSPNVHTFRSRKTSLTGGQGRFVQGNYAGHLSSWSEPIRLLDQSGRVVDALTHIGNLGNLQNNSP